MKNTLLSCQNVRVFTSIVLWADTFSVVLLRTRNAITASSLPFSGQPYVVSSFCVVIYHVVISSSVMAFFIGKVSWSSSMIDASSNVPSTVHPTTCPSPGVARCNGPYSFPYLVWEMRREMRKWNKDPSVMAAARGQMTNLSHSFVETRVETREISAKPGWAWREKLWREGHCTRVQI